MPQRLGRSRSGQEHWAKLSGRFISRKFGAEDAGFMAKAEALECIHDILRSAWLKGNATAKNRLYRYFGAPEDSVDLQQVLNNPANRRHPNWPHLSATPLGMSLYIKARNARVNKFEIWKPWGKHPDALVRKVTHLVRGCPASGKGANRALHDAMAARRKEIQALNKAIERCYVEGLATAQSASEFAQGLLFDPTSIPWQLGHVYLLRDLALDDIETTVEQRERLREVIKFLRTQQS